MDLYVEMNTKHPGRIFIRILTMFPNTRNEFKQKTFNCDYLGCWNYNLPNLGGLAALGFELRSSYFLGSCSTPNFFIIIWILIFYYQHFYTHKNKGFFS
jgi:hypothetical protein